MDPTPDGPEINTVNVGKAHADLEQIRAEALSLLRESDAFTLTALTKDHTSCQIHSCVMDQNEFGPFFAMNAMRAIQSLSKITDMDEVETLDFVKHLFESDWSGPESGEV